MYIVKITNNTPLCKMVNFSRSVLKIYTGQKKFTRAAPVAPVTNIRYAFRSVHLQQHWTTQPSMAVLNYNGLQRVTPLAT